MKCVCVCVRVFNSLETTADPNHKVHTKFQAKTFLNVHQSRPTLATDQVYIYIYVYIYI